MANPNYDATPAPGTLVIPKATPAITWSNPADIPYGTALSLTQLNATALVAGSFAYLPAAGTVPDVGSNPLHVDFTPADTANYNSASKDAVINVVKATPAITWSNPADITYGTALSVTQLNATTPVAGSFVYTPAAGTVLDAGNQTLHVDFTPTDTANYNSASKNVAINVLKATPAITWSNPADITYGTPLSSTQLNATTPVAGSFVYTPAAGTVLNTAGSQPLSVLFTPTDTANYTTASKTVTIAVDKATPVITWSNPANVPLGTPLSSTQLNATTPVAGSFVYTPAAGTVLNTAGSQPLSVLFTPTDTANYTTASKTVTIAVDKATPVITWSNPANVPLGTPLSSTQLNATTPVAGSFAYTPAAGTVLTTAGSQPLSVLFTPTDTATYTTATKTVTIVVDKATPVITWATPAAVPLGTPLSSTQLNATTPVAGSFVYTPAAGTVLNTAGSQPLSVLFTPTDTANYTTASKTVTIAVDKATPVITWSNPANVPLGTPLSSTQLNATTPVAGSFAYTPAAGTVLTTAGSQPLSVLFTPTDTATYTTATKTVTIVVDKATPVITWATPAAVPLGTPLSSTQLNATTPVAGSFAYTPAAGTVLTTAGSQPLSVLFTPTDTVTYTTATKTVTIVVDKATPVITWATPAAVPLGTPLSSTQLNATTPVAGSFAYTPAAGTVLTTAGSQPLSVLFTPTDTATYTTATKTVTIVVDKATPVITWATPAAVPLGTTLSSTQLNATTPVAGSFAYTPAAGTVLTTAGSQPLSVLFTPTDTATYTTATKTVTIVVDKATPVITWATPAAVPLGTPLSSTQLNATTPVAGSFAYTPAAGTVLTTAGSQPLSVLFTPTDTATYTTATKTVTIVVDKATPVITWATPAAVPLGTPLSSTQLNATTPVAGSFAYTPAAGTVLTTAGSQPLSVLFTPTDTVTYTTATKTVTIVVDKATPVITWATPAAVPLGTPLSSTQLNATTPVAGSFVYTPAAGTVLTTAGSQPLSVLFTPTDTATYTTASKTVTIVVDKATPAITWSNPANVPLGTTLSSTQLNATAPVAGSFDYTPAAGTVLNTAGSQTLAALFTTTRAATATTASKTVTIVVDKANQTITFGTLADKTIGDAPFAVSATASSGLAVTFSVVSGPATISGSTVTLTGATGTVTVRASQAGNGTYNAAADVDRSFAVNANQTITFGTPAANSVTDAPFVASAAASSGLPVSISIVSG